jgi:hypothetical protein
VVIVKTDPHQELDPLALFKDPSDIFRVGVDEKRVIHSSRNFDLLPLEYSGSSHDGLLAVRHGDFHLGVLGEAAQLKSIEQGQRVESYRE